MAAAPSSLRFAATSQFWGVRQSGFVHMNLHDNFVHGSGRRYAGRPMTRLFTILSVIGFGFLIVVLIALYNASWPPAFFSDRFGCVFC
jgi:hypothetical protein